MKLKWLKIKRTLRRSILAALVLILALTLSTSRQSTDLEAILARGELRMVTRPGPITYYQDAKGKSGLDYLLARDFARRLGVDLKVTTTASLAKLFNMLGGPNADLGAASLTLTEERRRRYRFSRPYADVVQTVIYRRGTRRPRDIGDLDDGELAVIADSSHEERLRELRGEHPGLRWRSLEDVEMVELMDWVHRGDLDYAVIDSTTYTAHRALYPRAKAAFEITDPQKLAWVFARHGDGSLIEAANRFLTAVDESGRLEALRKRFFGGIENFTVAGSQLFARRIKNRLPQYEPLFREVARETGIDWHLLAAIAYQESHWNPLAISPTGVRGLMMLTLDTAGRVGIDNRLDPLQSLRGGATYLLDIKSRLPPDIHEPDRTWFTLAAYNVGMGHLEDARVLTERAGRDPHRWDHVREFLPLLQQQKYYQTVRYGYARGGEPVIYVRNIRKYLQILQWNTIEKNRRQQQVRPDFPEYRWDDGRFLTL